MGKSIWKDIFVFRAYELARAGLSEIRMAKALGISVPTFRVWESKKKVFKLAVEEGRKINKRRGKDAANLRNYIFERLPKDLRKLWEKINKLDGKLTGAEKIEALLVKRGTTARQHLFVYAWVSGNFSLSQALRKVNIPRSTFDKWRNTDPDFAALIEEIDWHKKNFFEDHLVKLVAGGDVSSTIFVNKTYNRDRGYDDRKGIDIKVAGQITHSHVTMIDVSNLTLNARKEILNLLRLQKMKQVESRVRSSHSANTNSLPA